MTNLKRTETLDDLGEAVLDIFDRLRAGEVKREDAAEMLNAAGKRVSMEKVKLAYYALRSEEPDIPFIGKPGRKIGGTAPPARLAG